jgi:bifunctional non-homologous end joining protein LigD
VSAPKPTAYPARRTEPFDSDDYIFEWKIDGFRSLAYIENGQCEIISRNGNTFRNFKDLAQWIGEHLRVGNAVIGGEIACVDDVGRSVFNDLLFRRRECLFFTFDLLFLNGEDLKELPLIERKARLKRLLRRKRSRMLYVDHIDGRGQGVLREGLRTRSGGHRGEAEGLAISTHREAVTALDQDQEPRLFAGRRSRRVVRAIQVN